MRERWRALAARYEALGPRERVLVLVAALVALAAVFDALAFSPLGARRARLAQEFAAAQKSRELLAQELRTLKARADPVAAQRARRAALERELAELDRGMRGLERALVPPERMAKLLEEMVGRSGGLQLVRLRTLPVERFEPGPAVPRKEAPQPGTRPPARAVYRHGYEIVLQGSYAEVHDYLVRLERLPWRILWGSLQLDARRHPRLQATIVVHTLSLSKEWLVV